MSRVLPPGLFGADALRPGDRVQCGTVTVTSGMIDSFAALTGDRFEIHMSEAAAKAHGFDARVAHGLLVLSLIDGLKNQAPAQMKARASMGWDWGFRAPVLLGDAITVAYDITDIAPAKSEDQAILTLDFNVTNQRAQQVQRGSNRLLVYR
ncbi:MaoC/PaaZ C-terminal domain-containing protein [uncultured Tateyamaria sp.]|uniref:MaoC family dehydratase n=1 Tax=uncultured Tateyamaria sp. TaxID=455651 RepID=UPI00262CF91A|nr:MaoC/PaaZ C-terminal domain-containing protein [uncultured Tateyamaria sp.]